MSERTEMDYYPADEDLFARHHDAMEAMKLGLDIDPDPWVSDPHGRVKS